MDQKRKAVGEKDGETTPSGTCAIVTPMKKKQRRESKDRGSSSTDQSGLQGQEPNNSVAAAADDGERKQSTAVEVSTSTKNESELKERNSHAIESGKASRLEAKDTSDNTVNDDTVMGFSDYPRISNKCIMLEHYDFVRWARRTQDRTPGLEAFVTWSNKDGAKALEVQGMGNEVFTFGQHKGENFAEIAERDPGYHERYLSFLRNNGQRPPGVLTRYSEWLKLSKKERSARSSKKSQRSTSGERGNITARQVFPFGQHRGQTFWQVAQGRYKDMDNRPNPVLDEYISWFEQHSPTRHVAHQHHHDDIGMRVFGISHGLGYYPSDGDEY